MVENVPFLNKTKQKEEGEHDADVYDSNEGKGDFRFASFVSITIKMIFCAEAES